MARRPFSKMHDGDAWRLGIAITVVSIFAVVVAVVIVVNCNCDCRHGGVRYRVCFVIYVPKVVINLRIGFVATLKPRKLGWKIFCFRTTMTNFNVIVTGVRKS
jgi:hypothetical protein